MTGGKGRKISLPFELALPTGPGDSSKGWKPCPKTSPQGIVSEIPLITSHPCGVKPGQQHLLLRTLLKIEPSNARQTLG